MLTIPMIYINPVDYLYPWMMLQNYIKTNNPLVLVYCYKQYKYLYKRKSKVNSRKYAPSENLPRVNVKNRKSNEKQEVNLKEYTKLTQL